MAASSNEPAVAQAAAELRALLRRRGAIVSEASIPWTKDAQAIRDQLADIDLIAMLAATPGVSAEAIEICTTHKDQAAKMFVYMPRDFEDGFIHDSLLNRHGVSLRLLPAGAFEVSTPSALCTRVFQDALDLVGYKQRQAQMRPPHVPRLGVITALEVEFQAVVKILSNRSTAVARQRDTPYKEYVHGQLFSDHGGAHDVVVALAGKGNNKAAVLATELLTDFPSVTEIFMVGIAAAVPNLQNATEHVRLGDVVVSDEGGVIQYDMLKQWTDRIEYDFPFRPTDPDWVRRLRYYFADPPRSPKFWGYIDELKSALNVKQPTKGPLNDCPWLKDTKAARHPNAPGVRVRNRPRLHKGLIGSANIVQKSAASRDTLSDDFKRLRAIEMEGSGIAEAAWQQGRGYMVVRGMADFANDGKNKKWQPYAAIVAAAFTREFIESMPVMSRG
jgi:nucleoside phosphorylase